MGPIGPARVQSGRASDDRSSVACGATHRDPTWVAMGLSSQTRYEFCGFSLPPPSTANVGDWG